jgi:tRNA A37 threonylcarbamoyladenosine dehydratase
MFENKEINIEDYNQRFGGIARLYGTSGLKKILDSKIMIVGLGGVGSWCVEALARSGVGQFYLVDLDEVCITNTNRQICATSKDIGKLKAHVLKERILSINPNCKVVIIEDFFTTTTAASILDHQIDCVVDAIDSVDNKCLLIAKSVERNIPVITTGGAAGKSDPTQIKIDDLGYTVNDSLLQRIRKKLRREYGFSKLPGSSLAARRKVGIFAVYSPEEPVFPTSDGEVCSVPDEDSQLILDCESGMGSVTHVTGMFGFLCASLVLKQILKKI